VRVSLGRPHVLLSVFSAARRGTQAESLGERQVFDLDRVDLVACREPDGARGVAQALRRRDLRDRSRRLLGSLLRPHRRALWWLLLLVLIQNALAMAGPWLVGVGIDRGIPALIDGDRTPLALVVAGLLVSAAGSAALRTVFLLRAGRLGQTVLVLGILVLLAGVFLQGGPYAVGIGIVLAVVGLVVFVVGLRRRGRGPRD
jgi:hypothetical protein